MKTIPNVTYSIPLSADGTPATTAKLLLFCIESPSASGLSVAQLRARERVAKAIAASQPDILALEDADFASAKDVVNAMTWARYHPDLVAFCSQFDL